ERRDGPEDLRDGGVVDALDVALEEIPRHDPAFVGRDRRELEPYVRVTRREDVAIGRAVEEVVDDDAACVGLDAGAREVEIGDRRDPTGGVEHEGGVERGGPAVGLELDGETITAPADGPDGAMNADRGAEALREADQGPDQVGI